MRCLLTPILWGGAVVNSSEFNLDVTRVLEHSRTNPRSGSEDMLGRLYRQRLELLEGNASYLELLNLVGTTSPDIDLAIPVNPDPSHYVLKGENYMRLMAAKTVPAVDIHDVAVHFRFKFWAAPTSLSRTACSLWSHPGGQVRAQMPLCFSLSWLSRSHFR